LGIWDVSLFGLFAFALGVWYMAFGVGEKVSFVEEIMGERGVHIIPLTSNIMLFIYTKQSHIKNSFMTKNEEER
jgi:hypothetical protein